MTSEVVPIFPCVSLKDTLTFYVALGFRVTAEQHAPYVYGGVAYEDIELHFHSSKTLVPNTESSHIALVIVSAVDELHRMFVSGIKATYGRRFRMGIPRIGSVNSFKQDRRFNLLDPSGNRLIVVQPFETAEHLELQQTETKLEKALANARKFAYSRDDPRGAAKILDVALAKNETVPGNLRFRALVLRADIAVMTGDLGLAGKLLPSIRTIRLPEDKRRWLSDDLERLNELEQTLAQEPSL